MFNSLTSVGQTTCVFVLIQSAENDAFYNIENNIALCSRTRYSVFVHTLAATEHRRDRGGGSGRVSMSIVIYLISLLLSLLSRPR